MMYKKGIMLCALFLLMSCAAGCETTKGIGTGIDATAKGVAHDTSSGAKGLYGALMTADEWFRENLW